MRRSVLVRLLAVSLVVATCSIAAAAWLTTRSTSNQIRGDQQRSLETDNGIYDAVIEYGRAHASWDGVGPLLARLASDTGRTITIRTAGGTTVAVAAPGGAVPDVDPHSTPAAELDPLAPMVVGTGAASPERLTKVADDLPAAVLELTPEEIQDRARRAAKVRECLTQLGVPATTVTAPNGAAVVEFGGGEDVPKAAYTRCYDAMLDARGGREIAVRSQIAAATAACMREQGYAATVDEPATDDVPVPGAVELDVYDTVTVAARDACAQDATRAAAAPYVAPAALLFLASDRPSPSWFDNAGGTRILFVLLAVLLVTSVLTALGASRILRPIRSLTRAAQRMASGDLGARVRIRGGDELARLGTAFNAMADAVERNERQRKALVSDVAHELRNPLANVRGYLEGAQDDVVRVDGALVESLLEETLLLQHLIDDLQDLALADAGRLRVHPEPADGRALAEQVVAAHRQQAERAGVTLRTEGAGELGLDADPVRLRQALGNLVANALRYTQPGGSVTVAVRGDASPAGAVEFAVVDTGRGIPAEHLPHLFDRFYRADASRSRDTGGSGLGLAITRHLVEAHGGTIGVASKVGAGTRFTIRIPRAVPRRRSARRLPTAPLPGRVPAPDPAGATADAAPGVIAAPARVPSGR